MSGEAVRYRSVPDKGSFYVFIKIMVVPSSCLLSGRRNGCTPGCHCGERPELYCGDSWCDGRCGRPALTIRPSWSPKSYRAYGNQVAHGPLWQEFRRPWPGETVDILTLCPWLDADEAVRKTWWY